MAERVAVSIVMQMQFSKPNTRRAALMLGLALAALLPSHATAHAVRGALAPSDTRDAPSRTVRRRDAVDAASADESAAAARVASARAARRRVGFVRYARELVAGGVAEAMMDAALFPVDTLKARRQAFQRHRLPTARKPSMRELMALGNPLRGIGPAFLSALPAGASFVSAKWCMEMLAHRAMNSTGHGWAVTMAASACADVAYWAVRFPAETGRLRVQALQDRSTLAAIGRLLVDGGYRPSVLYRGWQTVLWRDVPYDALEVRPSLLQPRLRRPCPRTEVSHRAPSCAAAQTRSVPVCADGSPGLVLCTRCMRASAFFPPVWLLRDLSRTARAAAQAGREAARAWAM